MKNLTNSAVMLPGFHIPLRGRKRRSVQQVFADKIASLKRKSFKQIREILGSFIPEDHLKPAVSGIMSRRSIFSKGDIFLGDKGFCSYYDMVKLKEQGVDSVITLARRKPVSKSKCLKSLGSNDLLIKWDRPEYTPQLSYSKETMAQLPEELPLRQVRVVVDQPGFTL